MVKKTSLLQTTFAKPKTTNAGSTPDRIDTLERAVSEAAGTEANDSKAVKKKRQKSREDMVSTNLWMSPEAKKQLKIHTMTQDEGLEEYIRNAVNARLEKEGQEFRIA